MGAYHSKPITDKEVEEGGNEFIRFAATSMQGWRVHQEDAHSCVLDFGPDCSLFAVYDGHGGAEVAKYLALEFPKFLQKKTLLGHEEISNALKQLFLEFDAILREEDIIQILNTLKDEDSKDFNVGLPITGSTPEEIEEKARKQRDAMIEEAVALSKEAKISLESIIKQYANCRKKILEQQSGETKSPKRSSGEPSSQMVKRRKVQRGDATVIEDEQVPGADEGKVEPDTTSTDPPSEISEELNHQNGAESDMVDKPITNGTPDALTDESSEADALKSNGQDAASFSPPNIVDDTGIKKKDAVSNSDNSITEPTQSATDLTQSATATSSISVDGSVDPSATEDDDDDEDFNPEEEEEELGAEEETDNDEAGDEEEDEGIEALYDQEEFASGRAGIDSGSTACLTLLFKNRVVVANIGDSRAVLCRDGKALDLSVDHKPEDQAEKERIEKAGGTVSEDGRVNGGLNLSRAFGDHFYKRKTELPAQDQMITPVPDVMEVERTDKDTFLVIACDGIWNSMSSQEVVDFVNERLPSKSLKDIGAEICDHCCAPDTSGDGTGCDNMTIIIVDLAQKSFPAVAADADTEQNASTTTSS